MEDPDNFNKTLQVNNEYNYLDFKNSKQLKKIEKFFKLKTKFYYERLISLGKKENENALWWILLVSVSILGVASRLHYVTLPNNVVWDEAHFGKFASYYINRTYFFDVHPPGGKLLLAFFGYISGYNGTHSFERPAISYEGFGEIMYMRMCCAIVGAGMVTVAFCTIWNLTYSFVASTFAAFFVIYEIGTIALTKFILLDPLLMFFMMTSFHGLTYLKIESARPWSGRWWGSLVYIGISLGCVISVKFVGLFTIIVLGLYTVTDLWSLYSDTQISLIATAKHFGARFITLICIPITFYILIFIIHDKILYIAYQAKNDSLGDLGLAGFSPEFQMYYVNSTLYHENITQRVSYGNVVTLRNEPLGGGYLHSHNITYPPEIIKGNLQQITSWRGKDPNNIFRVLYPLDDPEMTNGFYGGSIENIVDNEWIRLHHILTNATVAAHRNNSLVATKLRLIYGRPYVLLDPDIVNSLPEDDNTVSINEVEFPYDIWRIKVDTAKEENNKTYIKPLQTRFQLINAYFHCALTWSKEKLHLKWGGQGEVSCTKNLADPYTFWIFETATNPYDNDTLFLTSNITFWERFIETHQMMKWVNARLKPQDYSTDIFFPLEWPVLASIHPWYDFGFRIVLMGNPLIFFLNFITLIIAPFILLKHYYSTLRKKNNCTNESKNVEDFLFAVRWLLIAYLIHYVPFLFMTRVLYFHHYFPALQFSSMLTAVMMPIGMKIVSEFFRPPLNNIIYKVFVALMFGFLTTSFVLYCYVTYGIKTDWPYNPDNSTFRHLRLIDSWEI